MKAQRAERRIELAYVRFFSVLVCCSVIIVIASTTKGGICLWRVVGCVSMGMLNQGVEKEGRRRDCKFDIVK